MKRDVIILAIVVFSIMALEAYLGDRLVRFITSMGYAIVSCLITLFLGVLIQRTLKK